MTDQSIQSCDVASKNQRFINCLLDGFPVWFLMGFVISVLGTFNAAFWMYLSNPAAALLIGYGCAFVYYFACEVLWQKTLAKLVTGTKVAALDGTKPTWKAIAIRTLVRFVPLEFVSFFMKNPGGWHDRWSGTVVVRTEHALNHRPQPAVNEPLENTGFPIHHAHIPAWGSGDSGVGDLEPVHAAAKPHAAQGTGPAWNVRNMKWIAIGGPIVILLGVFMVWSANQPVESASASSASSASDDQTSPIPIPPSEPSVLAPTAATSGSVTRSVPSAPVARSTPSASAPRSAPPSSVKQPSPSTSVARPKPSGSAPRTASPGGVARSVPVDSARSSAPSDFVPRSAPWGSAPMPAPTPSSPPAGLPATIQADAFDVVDGKLVAYTDMGELSEGQTVSGWTVVRVTRREVVFKNGDAVHTCPLTRPGSN